MSQEKKLAGEYATRYVEDGMTVGIGTGSTVYYTIQKLGEMVSQGLQIRGVSTSEETTSLCGQLGIPLVSLDETDGIDVTIDGADEVDPALNGIKGGHGALLREKMVAINSARNIWVVGTDKLVDFLVRDSIPVEVMPFGCERNRALMAGMGFAAEFREVEGRRFVTDSGNYILDLSPGRLEDPRELEKTLNLLTGVVECGLFLDIATSVVVAKDGGIHVLER